MTYAELGIESYVRVRRPNYVVKSRLQRIARTERNEEPQPKRTCYDLALANEQEIRIQQLNTVHYVCRSWCSLWLVSSLFLLRYFAANGSRHARRYLAKNLSIRGLASWPRNERVKMGVKCIYHYFEYIIRVSQRCALFYVHTYEWYVENTACKVSRYFGYKVLSGIVKGPFPWKMVRKTKILIRVLILGFTYHQNDQKFD